MVLSKSLQSLLDEQRARYGELFWYQLAGNKIILMIERLAEQARNILVEENVEKMEIVSQDGGLAFALSGRNFIRKNYNPQISGEKIKKPNQKSRFFLRCSLALIKRRAMCSCPSNTRR